MSNKKAAIKIIKRLNSEGFEALLAGGCVRDMLLGRRAKDYDVATGAEPKEVTKLFKRTLEIGAKFGVVMVLIDEDQVEVATFRTETGYVDGRHPSSVKFAQAKEDASRRDFTINGMFYDQLNKKVIDYVDGRADLKKKIIRTIGAPDQRFGEDYLRMLRAVRFATQLNFKIAPDTWFALCQHAKKITKISGERIHMELQGILADPNRATGASMLFETGLAKAVFGKFNDQQIKFAMGVVKNLRERIDFPLALVAFLAGFEPVSAIEKCEILKLSRNQTRHIKFLLENTGKLLDDKMTLAQLKMIAAEPYFEDLYEFQKAIQKAQNKSTAALTALRKRVNALEGVELKPEPLLNGHDLMRLGVVPGPTLGQLAEEMYIAQLQGQLKNTVQAQRWVQKWLQKRKTIEK